MEIIIKILWGGGKWIFDNFFPDWLRDWSNRRKRKDPKIVLEHRAKMKKEIDEGFYKWHKAGNTRDEVIIRDVRRMDNYPDIDTSKKGISPWFRAGYKGLYTRGIEIFLSMPMKVFQEDGKWRVTHDDVDGGTLAFQVGQIPFDNIVNIDWNGDEYYGYPHFYCSFTNKKQPYEKIVYCEICKTHDGKGHYYPYLYNDDHSMAGH